MLCQKAGGGKPLFSKKLPFNNLLFYTREKWEYDDVAVILHSVCHYDDSLGHYINVHVHVKSDYNEEFSTLLGNYAGSLKNYIGIYNSTVEEINNVLSLYKRKEYTKDEMQTRIENIVKNNYRDNASKAISGVLKLTRRQLLWLT